MSWFPLRFRYDRLTRFIFDLSAIHYLLIGSSKNVLRLFLAKSNDFSSVNVSSIETGNSVMPHCSSLRSVRLYSKHISEGIDVNPS